MPQSFEELGKHWPLWMGLGAQLTAQIALGVWFFAKQDAEISWHDSRITRLEAKMEVLEGWQRERIGQLAAIETKVDRMGADMTQLLRRSPAN